mmetsp:Transcript_23494/g.76510  ORF Transcript_23494/g.76510 Transcript_23494/m.76510 type:complete len:489 (+) Transcript_23494:229-1695(+)
MTSATSFTHRHAPAVEMLLPENPESPSNQPHRAEDVHVHMNGMNHSRSKAQRDSGHEVSRRLKVAKILSFSSGASMVAWNKFSTLWLLSVGLTPAQTGVMKSVGLIAKAICQPAWAAIADLKIPARIHPSLESVSSHFTAILSTVFSLVMMEALRRNARFLGFQQILLLRTIWAVTNAGGQLVDALVAQLSHRTKEGYGKQRLWGSVSWGCMSFVAGVLIDRFGLEALFAYTYVARMTLLACVVLAMVDWTAGNVEASGEQHDVERGIAKQADTLSSSTYFNRMVITVRERPQLAALLTTTLVHGFVMVVSDNVVSMQMDRDFHMSRSLNGLTAAFGVLASVPSFWYSSLLISKYGHFAIIMLAQGLSVTMFVLHAWVTKEYSILILPITAIKGAVVGLQWSTSVDLMQNSVDQSLTTMAQTLLGWFYYTIGGGIGFIFWSACYQHLGASDTYWLAAAVGICNLLSLRAWLGTRKEIWASVDFGDISR